MMLEKNNCSGYRAYYRISCDFAVQVSVGVLYSFNNNALLGIWTEKIYYAVCFN